MQIASREIAFGPEIPYWGLYFEAEEPNAVINMGVSGTIFSLNIQVSLDYGRTWIQFDSNNGTTPITLASVGDRAYFRAGDKNPIYARTGGGISDPITAYHYFTLSKKCGAHGNIMSLIDGNDKYLVELPLVKTASNFGYLFRDCSNLTSAPILPATLLQPSCYAGMFRGCSSLRNAPELPSTHVVNGCYKEMFYGCSKIPTAPTLRASGTISYCYSSMFEGCSSLVEAPTLSATTISQYAYQAMFRHCTSLQHAPELLSTTTSAACYKHMFYGCRSLEQPPTILPATSLETDCYYNMFNGCTSIVESPKILAPSPNGTNCCVNMFYGCSSLRKIDVAFTKWDNIYSTSPVLNWVDGVSSTGTFKCPSSLDTTNRGPSGCPENWEVVAV